MEKEIIPKRGDIFIVSFDMTIGSEIRNTRPALVIQNDVGNEFGPTTIVAAITAHKIPEKIFPTEVFIKKKHGGLNSDSIILLNQLRTIDKKRLVKKVGRVGHRVMGYVDRALLISIGLIEL